MSSQTLSMETQVESFHDQDLARTGDQETVISIENVGKMYKLYDRPVDRLKDTLLWRFGKVYGREFWALQDINLKVHKGETVGILGRNGAGKSTLLQIIAGVLQPTQGSINVKGRISALLELGSGFNYEYTGRENVFMNGAILGFSEEEIEKRFDEIVDFADIGQFIDQPVKSYSSGMVMRLAFSVASCVEPDILIVDEALAVGDIAFQARCFDKIIALMKQGTTTLFVTHDYGLVQRLCTYAYILEKGQIYTSGMPEIVSLKYYQLMRESEELRQSLIHGNSDQKQSAIAEAQKVIGEIPAKPAEGEYRFGNGHAVIDHFKIIDKDGIENEAIRAGEDFTIELLINIIQPVKDMSAAVFIRSPQGQNLMGIHSRYHDQPAKLGAFNAGDRLKVTFKQKMALNPGDYILSMALADHKTDAEFTSLDNRNNVRPIKVLGTRLLYSGIIHFDRQITWSILPD